MAHYVMTCTGVFPSAGLDCGPDRTDPPWISGQPVRAPVNEPLVYTLDAERPGNIRVMIDDTAYPIMRNDLIEALDACGIDNLEYFDAVVVDPTTGVQHHDYKAFNIVGAVAAADMAKSIRADTSDSTLVDVDFDSLAIDPNKAGRFRLFRLAESVDAIIVDDVVKKEIENRQIPGMTFYDPADWSG
jgi:hypothetical protein